jgi:glycosyltransferase involved in cell wall biosynthesis
MDKYIYILCECFKPNSAAVNRFLAFARGYGEQGVKVKAVFIQPNKKFDMVDESYQNVEFIYLWEKLRINNRYLKFLITRFYLLLFILKLKKGDIVVLYGLIHYLWLFIFKKNIKVYHERTESPDVVGRSHSFIGDIKHNLYLKACKKLDGLFVISPSLNKYFVEEVGVNYKKVHTINMIVDLTRFKDLDFTTKSNTITYCGTISEQKDGISYLLKAFAVVSKKHEEISLTLIGPFENETTKSNVLKLIKDLHIENKVVFLGKVSAENMPRILSDAKILALSRPDNKQAQYGFPTKLGEYLMTRRPVVITRVGDFDKYLNDKENVIFAKSDNVNDFAKKLLWTLDNYELAKEIGLKGSEAATNYFNYKIESQKVLKIIFETNIQIKAGS